MFKKAKDAAKGLTSILDLSDNSVEERPQVATNREETEETIEERVMKFGSKGKTGITESQVEKVADEEDFGEGDYSLINKNPRLKIYKPTYYEVVQQIGRDIRLGKIVLLDLSSLDEKTTIKIVQFISGICFALDIVIEDVGTKIISIDPQHKIGTTSKKK